jgi:hypothetical protein
MESVKHVVLFLTTSVLLCGCAAQQPSVKQTQEPPVKQQAEEGKLTQAPNPQNVASEPAEKTPAPAEATSYDGQAKTQKPRYEILRQWQPNDMRDGLGLELLMGADADEGEIVSLIKELSKGKDPVLINIYTDRKVYEDAKKNIYEESFDRHFILAYIKNYTNRGIFQGVNEIRWMQEVGKFSHLFRTATRLQKEEETPVSQP